MSISGANGRRETLSSMVDNIFDRYTVIPSSVADEDEIDELRASFENLGSEIPPNANNPTGDAEGRQDDVEKDTTKSSNRNESAPLGSTVDPRETQLASSSADTGAYARKTIPQTLLKTPSQVSGSPSSSNDVFSPSHSIIYVDSDSDGDIQTGTACERCIMSKIICQPNISARGLGAACHNCRLKRSKCSLVPDPKPRPGARGISTPPDGSFDSFRSNLYAITDSNDESFELDSYRVTLQSVFGKVSHLTKANEDRFARLEAQLGRIESKQDLILKSIEGGNESS